jgi:hypothetical protein
MAIRAGNQSLSVTADLTHGIAVRRPPLAMSERRAGKKNALVGRAFILCGAFHDFSG